MKQKIVNFGKAKCVWVTTRINGILYHSWEDYKTGRPPYKRVKSRLEQAIKSGSVPEAQ